MHTTAEDVGDEGRATVEAARRERLRAGFNLEQAARRLRVSAAYLRHIESKNTRVPWNLAVRMAGLYGTAPETFLPVEEASRDGNTGSRPRPTAGDGGGKGGRAAEAARPTHTNGGSGYNDSRP